MILRVDPHFIQIKRLKVAVVAAAAAATAGGGGGTDIRGL